MATQANAVITNADCTGVRSRISSTVILVTLLLATFLVRLPAALLPYEFNVDESQAISQAMKLLVDPRPWISVDGQSCGPLHSLFVTGFLVLGFKPGFVLAHMLASILVCLQVLLAYLTLRRIGSERAALLGGFLIAFVFSFTGQLDYLHYAGELLPTVLLLAGLYVFVLWLDSPAEPGPGSTAALAFVGGLALGIAPWCKLQAAPISAGLGLVFLVAILRGAAIGASKRMRSREVAAFLGGAGMTTFIMLATLVHSGAVKDFWSSYILGNLQYAGHTTALTNIGRNSRLFQSSPVNMLLIIGLCLGVYSLLSGTFHLPAGRQRWAAIAVVVYCAAAIFAVIRVRYSFPHHAIFLVAPFACAIAIVADSCNLLGADDKKHTHQRWMMTARAALGVIVGTLLITYAVGYFRMNELLRPHGQAASVERTPDGSSSANAILRHVSNAVTRIAPIQGILTNANVQMVASLSTIQSARPIRTLAVWGWSPGVYVLSGLPQATRDSNIFFVLQQGPMQGYYRARYLNDLRTNRPDVFVDARTHGADMWDEWTEQDGYESIPDVRNFIDQNYILVHQLTLRSGEKPVRFFVRRDLCCGSR